MPPIYLGDQPVEVYKGEQQLESVIVGETIVNVYTNNNDTNFLCCVCTQVGNDTICEPVTEDNAELCNSNSAPLCPDGTCDCNPTITTTPAPTTTIGPVECCQCYQSGGNTLCESVTSNYSELCGQCTGTCNYISLCRDYDPDEYGGVCPNGIYHWQEVSNSCATGCTCPEPDSEPTSGAEESTTCVTNSVPPCEDGTCNCYET